MGATLFHKNIPFSFQARNLIKDRKINSESLLNGGDDYELIFTAPSNVDNKITNIFKKNKYKLSKVGRIINKNGIFIDGKKLAKTKLSFQYFF